MTNTCLWACALLTLLLLTSKPFLRTYIRTYTTKQNENPKKEAHPWLRPCINHRWNLLNDSVLVSLHLNSSNFSYGTVEYVVTPLWKELCDLCIISLSHNGWSMLWTVVWLGPQRQLTGVLAGWNDIITDNLPFPVIIWVWYTYVRMYVCEASLSYNYFFVLRLLWHH